MTLGDRPPARSLLSAAVVAVCGLILTWLLNSLPAICPAVYPAPESCAADARLLPAIATTLAIVVVFAMLALIALLAGRPGAPRRSWPSRAAMVVLVLVTVAGLFWTLTSSGFASG